MSESTPRITNNQPPHLQVEYPREEHQAEVMRGLTSRDFRAVLRAEDQMTHTAPVPSTLEVPNKWDFGGVPDAETSPGQSKHESVATPFMARQKVRLAKKIGDLASIGKEE